MREGEPEAIRKAFQKFKINFVIANAQERFMEKLKGVSTPKRNGRSSERNSYGFSKR